MPTGVYIRTEKHRREASEVAKKRGIGKWFKVRFLNENHPHWKGGKVGYSCLHKWLRRKLGTPDTCKFCKKSGLTGKHIDWANKSGEYKRDLADYIRLCRSCHMKYDKSRFKNPA